MQTADKFATYDKTIPVHPALAKETSNNEAMFIAQLEYWIGNEKSGKVADGRKWIRDTVDEWQSQIVSMSYRTVRRTITKLVNKKLVDVRTDLNRLSFDKTRWYTPNFDNINKLFDESKYTINVGNDVNKNKFKFSCDPASKMDSSEWDTLDTTIPKISSKNKYYSQLSKVDREARCVIDYLNKHANKHFRYSKSSLRPIKARLRENYTSRNFKHVIDVKIKQWLYDKSMNQYLRPNTLFSASKFDPYLNTNMDSEANISSHKQSKRNMSNNTKDDKDFHTSDINKQYEQNKNELAKKLKNGDIDDEF